jgi:hypothetical protein
MMTLYWMSICLPSRGWVDDVRYFGTERLVKEYESTIAQHCKCTFEGESKEFVSIEIYHQVDEKILELKQADY